MGITFYRMTGDNQKEFYVFEYSPSQLLRFSNCVIAAGYDITPVCVYEGHNLYAVQALENPIENRRRLEVLTNILGTYPANIQDHAPISVPNLDLMDIRITEFTLKQGQTFRNALERILIIHIAQQ